MRPTDQTLTTHISSPVRETMNMKLDQNSLVHLMGVLTNLYANPIKAVIREYSTNAWDSHVDAGIKEPIEIGLPSSFNAAFTVTDHGLGLSVDDLRDVYAMYGLSTKRESDEVNGMLGLGCKSGLTYALSFSVTAVKNGVKTVATITKDEDGVGIIKILDTVSTDEHNGVQISIPVKAGDIDRFRNEAKEFYRYWKPGTVKVDGKIPDMTGEYEQTVWLDEDVCVIIGRNGHYNAHSSIVVMGNVAYPIPPKLASRSTSQHRYGVGGGPPTTCDRQFVAWVPIGSLNFTPSREAVMETKLTKETILEVQQYIDTNFVAAFDEKLESLPTPFEKMIYLNQWAIDPAVRRGSTALQSPKFVKIPSGRKSWSWDGMSCSKVDGDLAAKTFLPRTKHVVYNFPFLGVSPVHKARFEDFGIESCIIIPDDTDMSPVQGRPNMVDWRDIVEATAKPNLPKSVNATPKAKTLYGYWFKGDWCKAEVVSGPEKVMYVHHHERVLTEVFPEAKIVLLTSQQDKRFLRLHPGAIWVHDHYQEQRNLAMKALTDMDKIRWTTSPSKSLRAFNPDDLLDPDLKKVCEANSGDQSATLKRALLLDGVRHVHPHQIHGILERRYPLYNHYGVTHPQDMLVYFNAKWLAIQSA